MNGTKTIKILCLQKYAEQMATYRYRFAQYTPFFEKHKIHYDIHSLISDKEISLKFKNGRYRIWPLIKAYWSRIKLTFQLKKYDLIVVYVEAMPYMPFFLEWLLFYSRKPFIFDLDDPVYLNYQKSRNLVVRFLFGKKMAKVFQMAQRNFLGSPAIVAEAQKYSQNVHFVPTVVSLAIYDAKKSTAPKANGPLIVGWLGSPTTASELPAIFQLFQNHLKSGRIKMLVIGAQPPTIPLDGVEFREWRKENQFASILEMDVGIMPLEDNEWNRGKCGFKLIQYMALGLPVIASAVGANLNIVTHGKDGFLAATPQEWLDAVDHLIAHPNSRQQMGESAREKIRSKFSLEKYGDFYSSSIREVSELTRQG